VPLAREELGAIETEGFHADEDLACLWGWDGAGFELEDFWSACCGMSDWELGG
jgi:hypothetical protein